MKLILLLLLMSVFIGRTLAGEKNEYDFLWLDMDKKVYVLQNKVYRKTNTWFIDLGYLGGLNNDYQNSQGLKVDGGYYFTDQWGIEVFDNFLFSHRNK